jgi:uncharacterized membrane-anchored protein
MSYFARLAPRGAEAREQELLHELLDHFGVDHPVGAVRHFAADLGPCRVRWERHTEFARYSFAVDAPLGEPFESPPFGLLPQTWMDQHLGSVLTAAHTVVEREHDPEISLRATAQRYFDDNLLVGAQIAGGGAVALTDFRIHADGFNRVLVLNDAMSPWQTGRMVQRLLEIETYRMMALLALPVAQGLAPQLTALEESLGAISANLVDRDEAGDRELLQRLLRLDAESEALRQESQYRFAAAEAYYGLVMQRTSELREVRIRGLQNFEEFTTRRLTPAVNTCRATAARHVSLAERLAHATQLLSTRVDVRRQQQNQSLLTSMNQRAKMQLRLQATVEGLSVAAITYYVVGLVYYALQGLDELGLPIEPKVLTAASVPVVATAIFIAVRHVRRHIAEQDDASEGRSPPP